MSNDIWTIKAALDWCQGYLERKGDEHPRLSAEWLLAEATGKRRIEPYVNFDEPLSMEERDTLRGFVTRRGQGEPLQYITGEVGFRHIAVKVRPGVLIPRPETEVLVSEALALLPQQQRRCATDSMSGEERAALDVAGEEAGAAEEARSLLVADICTGSGCIACSVAYERPDARVVATDIEPLAIALAQENARNVGVAGRVEVVEGDLGESIDPGLLGTFDLVISNPPYVPTPVMAEIPSEVADFEPVLALDGGVDGLDIFRRLVPWCQRALKPGGGFAFELHEGHMNEAAAHARDAGFEGVRIVNDLAGRPRILVGRMPGCREHAQS